MKRTLLFIKRNFLEMVRDPLVYIFCAGFPIAMCLLFQLIVRNTSEVLPTFSIKSLVPGISIFSYSLLMLMGGLLISKDRTSAFLRRLFTSPLKSYQFIIGYFVPFFLIGIVQTLISLSMGYIFSAIDGVLFASFSKALLFIISMFPIMIINIALGMVFGTLMNDKSAPAISSIFVSAFGILGGAWMPLETMGGFETFAKFLPFYPSTSLGRMIIGAPYLSYDANGVASVISYTFNNDGILYIVNALVYMVVIVSLSLVLFRKKMSSDRL